METFEAFLYKNNLNEKSLINIMDKLSINSINSIMHDFKKDKSNIIYAFSDGGCIHAGKNNCKAGYSIYFPEFDKFNKTRLISTEPTNNKAELSAIKAIFKTINLNKAIFEKSEIIICTDSQYSIDCIIKWSDNWIKNGWINSKKETVKNKELIQDILNLKNSIGIKISFKHVFSHIKEPKDKMSMEYFFWNGNNIVDSNINQLFKIINESK